MRNNLKKFLKKTLATMLVAGMGMSLIACGGDNGNGSDQINDSSKAKTGTHFYSVDYLTDLPESVNYTNGSPVFYGDTLYYTSYDQETYLSTMYSYNLTTKEEKSYWTETRNNEDPFAATMSVNRYVVDKEGNLYLYLSGSKIDESKVNPEDYADKTLEDILNAMVDEWGYGSYEEAEQSWNENMAAEYGENPDYGMVYMRMFVGYENYIQMSSLIKLDADGNEIYSKELDVDMQNGGCNAFEVDSEGNMYLSIEEYTETSDEQYILILDKDGKQIGNIKMDSYVQNLIVLNDGKIGALSSLSEGGNGIHVLDPDGQKIEKTISLGDDYVNRCLQKDETHFWISGDDGLYLYDTEKNEKELYTKWMDNNISGSNINNIYINEEGKIYIFSVNYNSSSQQADIAVLTEVDESQVNKATTINIACYYMDYRMQEAAIEFNKKNEDYHINVTEYYEDYSEMDWQDAQDAFTTAMVNDTTIDAVVFNDYNQAMNFASKGLLTDLYEVIGNDKEINKDTILPNILSACEYDGKLAILPTGFSVTTLVGKVSDVGDRNNWTVSDMMELIQSKPEGTKLLNYTTRDEALNLLLSLSYSDFIDMENTTCHFNTQEFEDVLAFANLFPEEYEYEEDVDDSELMHDGKILLYQTSLPDFGQMQMLEEIYGSPITYIGYPCSSGTGSMLYLNNVLGITKNCKDVAVTWDFLRQIFLTEEEYANATYYDGSILKSRFDKFFDSQVGSKDYDGNTWGWGNYEVTLHAPTQEEVDEVKETILGTTAVNGAVSNNILNIIKEEAASYFSGEKSASDVAAIVQSRMEIYLSETK